MTTAAPASLFDRMASVARSRWGWLVVGAWAFAEAIAFPIVPDVLLGLLVLAAPRSLVRLFVALVVGALLGTVILYAASLAAPDAVRAMLLALPGIDPVMVEAAVTDTAGGSLLALAGVGPGTPLKVYTYAWATGPGTPLVLAVGVVVNRFTRVLPPVIALAVVGWLAPGWLRRHERLVLVAYAAFYVVAYVLYWS